ncbi:MAG: FecR domain-containing protein [Devosia sp.]
MHKLVMPLVGAVLALLLASPVLAGAVGSAKGVDPQAQSILANEERTLVVGADVFLGDKITTGPKGLVQIVFVDNTKFVVGPNSSVTIDQYLLRGDNTASKVAIDLLGGSYRFITGDSPKSAYQLTTPVGTIGVRGTKYDIYVDDSTDPATVYAMVYTGTVLLSDTSGDTELLSGFCHIGVIEVDDPELLGDSNAIFGDEREDLKGWFRFSLDQSRLLPEFRIGQAGTCTRRPPVAQTPPSLLDGGSSCGAFEDLGDGYYGPNNCGQCPAETYNNEGYCEYPG